MDFIMGIRENVVRLPRDYRCKNLNPKFEIPINTVMTIQIKNHNQRGHYQIIPASLVTRSMKSGVKRTKTGEAGKAPAVVVTIHNAN